MSRYQRSIGSLRLMSGSTKPEWAASVNTSTSGRRDEACVVRTYRWALVYSLFVQTLKIHHVVSLIMTSGQPTRTRPIGIKLICGVEGVGGVFVGILLLLLGYRAIFEGEPPVLMLIVGVLSLLIVFLVALYGLWMFTSWGWWTTVILHTLSGLHTGWAILVTNDIVYQLFEFRLEQGVVRFILAVLILIYLYFQRDLYL